MDKTFHVILPLASAVCGILWGCLLARVKNRETQGVIASFTVAVYFTVYWMIHMFVRPTVTYDWSSILCALIFGLTAALVRNWERWWELVRKRSSSLRPNRRD